MTLDLDRVHWPSFSVAIRIFMEGFADGDDDAAKASGVPAGVVRRARSGQRVALLNFKKLCAWMDRKPEDFLTEPIGEVGGARAPASQGSDDAAPDAVASSSLPQAGSFDR